MSNHTTRIERPGDGTVVKHTTYPANLEADGVRQLADAGLLMPRVLEVSENSYTMTEVTCSPRWELLGRSLARCHRTTSLRYGFDYENVIGSADQRNTWMDTWSEFYATFRLEIVTDGVPDLVARRLRAAIDNGRLADLLEHGQAPSLVHGDIWSGNLVGGSAFIDPAPHFADREFDVAFARLFGGIPERFFAAYEEVWPLDHGWKERQPALQLYHLLLHVHFLGGSYIDVLQDRLDRLGW